MGKHKLAVTDRAVITYLETGLGVNIEGIRRRIARQAQLADTHGAAVVRTNGLRISVCGGVVIHVAPGSGRAVRRLKNAKKQ